jgi:type IV pilus assembly protein PilY1
MSLSQTTPQVLLVMSKDHRMFQQAYNNLTDLDGDGDIDVGFDPSITYYGYFDPDSCYKYSSARFERAGFADKAHPEATAPTRPSQLAGRPDITVPPSAHGVCPKASDTGAGGEWSGNWLNYLLTSHMDAMRKVLYGGKRQLDTTLETVISGSFTPKDCHVWGVEAAADDIWADKMRNMPYYDLSLYTAYTKPRPGTYTFFARYQSGNGSTGTPTLEAVTRVNSQHRVAYFGTELRIWDWTTGEASQPDASALPSGILRQTYNVQVKVCDAKAPGGITPGENCERYSNGAWKPAGLLQEYGADEKMYFGLITGSADKDLRTHGGVLRRHVESMSQSVDYSTGQRKSKGILDVLDSLRITGWSGTWYNDLTAWGDPMGEMLYEAVRYYAGAPRAHYATSSSDTFGAIITDWSAGRPKIARSSDCARPIIIIIGHAYPDFDWDGFPSSNGREVDQVLPLLAIRGGPAALSAPFSKDSYLEAITANEGLDRPGRTFFYSRGPEDDCSPEPVSSLADVKGLCPLEPAREGSYSAAAVAWFAHTHNLSGFQELEAPAEIYSLALSSTFPEITFDLGESRSVSVIPASETGNPNLLGFMNYFVVDWQTDSTGLPFYIKIVTNFDGDFEGADYDRDALGTYEFSLLTTRQGPDNPGGSPEGILEPSPLRVHAGELKDPLPDQAADPFGKADPPTLYYRFMNYRDPAGGRDYSLPRITIDRSKVVGFAVSSDAFGSTTGGSQSVGYTITGTTRDGSYMDVSHTKDNFKKKATVDANNPWPNLSGVPTGFVKPDRMNKPRNSPWSCLYPGGDGCGQGTGARMTYYLTRGFRFAPLSSKPETLPSPLWLAAKYGGFKDVNRNGLPDPGEWERDPGAEDPQPANYFTVSNAGELREQLGKVFASISRGAGFGSSTAASLASDSVGGLSVQTIFYPRYDLPGGEGKHVPFVGSVFALFLDRWGNLREDTDGDGRLTLRSDGASGDDILTFSTLSPPPEVPPPCYEPGRFITRCHDEYGSNDPEPAAGSAHPPNPHQIKPVWDAGRWLMELDATAGAKLTSGARPWASPATLALGKRRVYFGYRDAAGAARQGVFDLKDHRKQLRTMLLHENYQELLPRSGTRDNAVTQLVNWVLGAEYTYLRKRTVPSPWNPGSNGVWRLGDIMNSKPIVAGAPASHYDQIYGDLAYAHFKRDWARRRHVVYFGANDGMLHAVNAGFGGTGSDGVVSFTKTREGHASHDLGAEVWAYIPMSLMPHLAFLADPEYVHSYYVDLKPLVTDVQIGGEWRTVLIGGLRLGGRPIEPGEEDLNPGRAYYSEVFCLDVTDPEEEPRLLWTYTSAELGLMVGMPSVVRSGGKWYVLLPSGPVTDTVTQLTTKKIQVNYGGLSPYLGVSSQHARIIVLDAGTGRPEVDPAVRPDYLRAQEPESFFNNPFLPKAQRGGGGDWSNHAVYFGLTETSLHGSGHDGGALYRVEMADSDGDPLHPADWRLRRLIDTGRPVTGAVNSARDSSGNIWVLFGTGRLFGMWDMHPCMHDRSEGCFDNHDQYLMGVKEPLNGKGLLTFGDVSERACDIADVTGAWTLAGGEVVNLAAQQAIPLWPGVGDYGLLERALRDPAALGWKRRLDAGLMRTGLPTRRHEMVLTQPKLVVLGPAVSVLGVTSFEPTEDVCSGYGSGYLYALGTFTGLPHPGTAPMFKPLPSGPAVPPGAVAGVAGLGSGNPTEAILLETRDRIGFRAGSSDGGSTDLTLANTSANFGGILSWREVLDSGFAVAPEFMVKDLED